MLIKTLCSDPDKCWADRMNAWRRNLLLIAEPFVLAACMTGLWYLTWSNGYHFDNSVDEMLGNVINVLAVIFAVPAGLVFATNWEHYQKLRRAVFLGDKREFLITLGDTLPRKVHLALAGLGLPPLILTCLGGYPSVTSGGAIVFSLWFGMALYFTVSMELQNPKQSVWFSAEAPPDWLQLDPRVFLQITCTENGEQHVTAEVTLE